MKEAGLFIQLLFTRKNKKNNPKSFFLPLNNGTQKPQNNNVQLNPINPLSFFPSFSKFILTDIGNPFNFNFYNQ